MLSGVALHFGDDKSVWGTRPMHRHLQRTKQFSTVMQAVARRGAPVDDSPVRSVEGEKPVQVSRIRAPQLHAAHCADLRHADAISGESSRMPELVAGVAEWGGGDDTLRDPPL